MLTIINLLIIIFIVLIVYQIFLAHFSYGIIEGLDNYKEYNTNDPNNVMEITFGPNGGNATINLQRDQKTTTARVGNSASNTITIKQSK